MNNLINILSRIIFPENLYKFSYASQGPKGDNGINPFSPFPRKGLPGDAGLPGLPGIITSKKNFEINQ